MSKLKIIKNPEWTKEEQDEFQEEIKANGNYCPCSVIKTKDFKCMCTDFKKQDFEGECNCGLYCKTLVK